MTRTQTVIFSVLHATAALLLPLLLFLLGGCLDPEAVNKPGPSIPCADVERAMNDSLPGPWTFEVGEFTDQIETAAPVNQAPSVVGEITEKVLSVSPQAGYYNIDIEQTVIENGTKDTTEGMSSVPGEFSLCPAQPVNPETYHNLTIEHSQIPVPMDPTDVCDPRYSGCKLNATTIKFDKIITTSDGQQLPVHYLIITSNEVPYLSRILELCYTYPYETNGQKIPVTRCTAVQNFKFKS